MRRHADDPEERVTQSCLVLLVILAGLIIGELLWVVLFTWVAVWLRDGS